MSKRGKKNRKGKKNVDVKTVDVALHSYKVISAVSLRDLVTDVSLYCLGQADILINMKHDKRNCTNRNFTLPHAI